MNAPAPRALRGRPGFTLVELLTVISIIGILVAMLLPAIAGAQRKARETKCVSQVRQIIAARILYTGDQYGNLIPNRPRWTNDPKGVCTWRWLLKEQYGVSESAFVCPSAPNSYTEAGRSESFATAKSDVKANYAQVGEVYGNDSKSRRFSLIPSPAKQLELVETRDFWPDMNMGSWGWIWADGRGVYGYWHALRTTAGFADGHVEVKKLGSTATKSCAWDTPAGPHDGAMHPEYSYMLDHYK